MKNLFKYTFLIVLLFFGLTMVVKGVWGNPEPEQITDHLRTETAPFQLSPERGRYALLTSINDYHSLFFPDNVAEYVSPDLGFINGKFASLFAPGVSYIAIPFYKLGKMFNLGQVFAFATSAFFALLNVILITAIVEKVLKNWYAGAISGITFLFATASLAYAGTLYQHHITLFLLLLCIYLLMSKPKKYTSLLIGAAFGISIFEEYPNAVFFIPIIIADVWRHVEPKLVKDKLTFSINYYLLLGVLGAALTLLPTYFYNKEANGNPFKLAGTLQSVEKVLRDPDTGRIIPPERMTYQKTALGFFDINRLPRSMSVLLTSKDRGVVWFSPVILLSLLGISTIRKRNGFLAITVLSTALITFGLYGMWGDPWGGWAFGPRYLIPVFGLMAIFLGGAIYKYGNKLWFSILFSLLFIYSLFVNITGALTTLQIPPSVEADSLRYPKPTFLYNYDMLISGDSSSFIYNNFVSDIFELKYYALMIGVPVLLAVLLMLTRAYQKKGQS